MKYVANLLVAINNVASAEAIGAGDLTGPYLSQFLWKPLVYGLALQDRGRDAVLAKIGVEAGASTLFTRPPCFSGT